MLAAVPCTFLLALALSAPGRSDGGEPAAPSTTAAAVDVVPAAALADPMLAPVAPAATEIGSWTQARELLAQDSIDLRVTAAEVDRARGRWRQALSALLPSLGASGGVGYDVLAPTIPVPVVSLGGGLAALAAAGDATPTTPLASAAVVLRQGVVNLSSWSALDAAGGNADAASARAEDVERRVLHGLASAIVAVATSERVAELARLGLRQALERAAMTSRLVEIGAAMELDLVRVRQDVAVARIALTASDDQLRKSRESLGALLGKDGPVGVSPQFAVEGLVVSTKDQCRRLNDVVTRADVRAASAQQEAAEAARREAWTGYLPSLDLTSNLGAHTTDPLPGRFATWTIAAVVSVPLWEGGYREGLLQERTAAATQAHLIADDTRRSAVLEVERATHAARAAEVVVASAREAHALAAELDRLTRRSFEMGRADSLDLVQSAVVLRQAQIELAVREAAWLRARLDAHFVLAGCSS